MGIREVIKNLLTHKCEQRYEKALSSRTKTYEEWLPVGARADDKDNEKVSHARAGWPETESPENESSKNKPPVYLIQTSAGSLTEESLAVIEDYFTKNPDVVLAYGDEDVRDMQTGRLRSPWFKPDWSPDTFLQSFYWGSLVAIRRSFLETECSDSLRRQIRELPGSQEAMLSVMAALAVEAGGFQKGSTRIGHIPQILFHGQSVEQQEIWAQSVQGKYVSLHGEEGRDTSDGQASSISIIIPSKDHPRILKQCLEALLRTKGNCRCEVIVVDNGSTQENREAIEAFLEEAPIPTTYLYRPMEFNFSAMCNLGAEHAKGTLLLLLNDDVEVVCEGWLEKMAHKALQPYVGAVGMKLYYPDSIRMQHDGIVNLPMGPVHKLQFLEDDRDYYYGYNRIGRNVLAVTAACLMVQKEKYALVGGMKEILQVAFNDVDLCFSLWEQGYQNVVLNSVHAYHHESLSRGDDESARKLNRLLREKDKLYELHPGLKGYDPYYPQGLNGEGLDTGIRPAYLTAGNTLQEAVALKDGIDIAQYRRDACLLFRVEQCDEDCIQGYGVVLGDNNACYRRTLVLQRYAAAEAVTSEPEAPTPEVITAATEVTASEEATLAGKAAAAIEIKPQDSYCIRVEGQYRPDLVENMPDQNHVGLCGFRIHLDKTALKPGTYRLGMAATSLVGGTKLLNWSNRWIQV